QAVTSAEIPSASLPDKSSIPSKRIERRLLYFCHLQTCLSVHQDQTSYISWSMQQRSSLTKLHFRFEQSAPLDDKCKQSEETGYARSLSCPVE
ncbi:unnamed protein product, partial [Hymenolepis diminuta]